jgi:hypothetical protein
MAAAMWAVATAAETGAPAAAVRPTPNSVTFAQTAAEVAAGVTPANYSYPPGVVFRYGAIGDGKTDDAPAFAQALRANAGGTVVIPAPPVAFRVNSTLTIPPHTTLAGENKHSSKLILGANVDMMNLMDGAQLYRLYLDGDGAHFTGRGLVIKEGQGNQTVQNSRIINFGGTPVAFAATDAGSRSVFNDVEAWQTGGTTGTRKYAFTIPDVLTLSAHPRKFTHIETGGYCAFSFGGSNDVFVSDSFLGDLEFSPNSRAVQISANRIANQKVLTIDGANHSVVGNDIAPQIVLSATLTNSVVGPNSMNVMPIVDHQTQGTVQVTQYRWTYDPVVSSAHGDVMLGNGTLHGYYSRAGSIIEVTINLSVGSTTKLGSGELRFSLPLPKLNGEVGDSGSVVINHAGNLYTAVAQIPGNVNYVTMIRDGSGSVTAASPANLGSGDTIRLTFIYTL